MVIPIPKKIGITDFDRVKIREALAANLQGAGNDVPSSLMGVMEGLLIGMNERDREQALASLKSNLQAASIVALVRNTVEADQLQHEAVLKLNETQRKKQLEAFAAAEPKDKLRELLQIMRNENRTSGRLIAAAVAFLGGSDKLSEAWARYASNARAQNEAAEMLLAWSSGGATYSVTGARIEQASYSSSSGYIPPYYKAISEPLWERPLREWQLQQQDPIWRDGTPIFPNDQNDPRKVALDKEAKKYEFAAVDYRTGSLYVPGKGQVAPNGDVIQTPAQLAQLERQIVQLKSDAIIHDGIPNPNGTISLKLPNGEDGAVVRINPQTGKLETVIPAAQVRMETQIRREQHAMKIEDERRVIAAERHGVTPDKVTPKQVAAEIHYQGQTVSREHAGVIRDTNRRADQIIAEQDAIARQQVLNGVVAGTSDPKAAADATFVSSYGNRRYWVPWLADKWLGRDSVLANRYDNFRYEGANDGNPHVAKNYMARISGLYHDVFASGLRNTIGGTPKTDAEGRDNAKWYHRVAGNVRWLLGRPDGTPPLPQPEATPSAPAPTPGLGTRMYNAVAGLLPSWGKTADPVVASANTTIRAEVPTPPVAQTVAAPEKSYATRAYEAVFGKKEPPAPAQGVAAPAVVVPQVITPTVTIAQAEEMDARLTAAAQGVELPRAPLSRTTALKAMEPARDKTTEELRAELAAGRVLSEAGRPLVAAVVRDGAANQSVEVVRGPKSEAAITEAERRKDPEKIGDKPPEKAPEVAVVAPKTDDKATPPKPDDKKKVEVAAAPAAAKKPAAPAVA